MKKTASCPFTRFQTAGITAQEEHDFWQMIVSLIMAGYRVQ